MTGYLAAFNPGFREALERSLFPAPALGLLTTGLMFFFPVDLTPLGEIARYGLSVLCRAHNPILRRVARHKMPQCLSWLDGAELELRFK